MKFFGFFFFLIGSYLNSYAQYIQVDSQSYSAQELIENVLINNDCFSNVVVTNVVGGNFGTSDKSYGYFDATGTSFPISSGIVLSTGRLSNVPGPNTSLSDDNASGWSGDADLETILNDNNTTNATSIEFEFESAANEISFQYLFASEEYQQGNANTCNYSDLFAFLIRPISASNYTNIAVVPNTNTPVKVTTVHSGIPGACNPINEDYFAGWNPQSVTSSSPTTFNGGTTVLEAKAQVQPNQTYQVKLVIADHVNYRYDSAVFLASNSFSSTIDLGTDQLISTNNALCNTETITLDAAQNGALSYTWYKDGVALLGENNTSYTVTEPGNYSVSVALSATCYSTGFIEIEYIETPVDNIPSVTTCNSYTLPVLTNGNYYTQPNGNGAALTAGTVITTNQDIYIYNENGNCSEDYMFTITISSDANPTITSIEPNSGPANTLVHVYGTNFSSSTSLIIDGATVNFNFINSTEGTFIVPEGTSSTATIQLENTPDCTSNFESYTYLNSNCIPVGELFISEVYDSFAGNYGIIELFNPTSLPISLDGVYAINRYATIGNALPSLTIPLTGTIAALDTFTIEFEDPINNCTNFIPDFSTYSGINATDEIELIKNGIAIDNIHTPNEIGYTMIRNPTANEPQTSYNSVDWQVYSNETCANLDMHVADALPVNTPTITHPSNQEVCEENAASFVVAISPNPSTYSYQWMVLHTTTGVWTPLTDDVNYSGTSSNTLSIVNTPNTFNENQYYCEITSAACNLVSNAAQLTVYEWPLVDTLANVTACDSYTLPTLTNGNYFTQSNGMGTALFAGDTITLDDEIFIYAETSTTPNCTNESSFQITIHTTPLVDTLPNVESCNSYTLPALNNGNYFTATQGNGTALFTGDTITLDDEIFIYAENATNPNCFNESSFQIAIHTTPLVDTLPNVESCNSYTLPALNNGNYFTQPNGMGTALFAGYTITADDEIFIYAETGTTPNCFNESSFQITIHTTPPVDTLPNVESCNSYTLPTLTNGNYFTQPNGMGTALFAGEVINTSQTIYIYNETASTPNCFSESSFMVTVHTNSLFTLSEDNLQINQLDVVVTMSDTSIEYLYAIDNIQSFQTSNSFYNLTEGNHFLYVTDSNNCHVEQLIFNIDSNRFYIPKHFSPNGDTYQDSWQVEDADNGIVSIQIFNRYGKLLKHFSNADYAWDGTYNGENMAADDYWYVIRLKDKKEITGHFALIR